MIDIDPAAGTEKFRYVISRTSTPACKVLIKVCKFLSVKVYGGCKAKHQHQNIKCGGDGGGGSSGCDSSITCS